MVGTISPMVHGDRQSGQRLAILALHTLGYLSGGGAVGYLVGAFGETLLKRADPATHRLSVLVLTGFVGLLYSSRELGLLQVPSP